MTDPRDDSGGVPVSRAAFAALMDALGPFEPAPHIAFACSGGADSTALALLAHDWAAAAGGRATALTVVPGSKLSATIRALSSADQSRRRPEPVKTSKRRTGSSISTLDLSVSSEIVICPSPSRLGTSTFQSPRER